MSPVSRAIRLVDPVLTAPERPERQVSEQSLALFALRDENARIFGAWRAPVLDETAIEQHARTYLASPIRRVMTFAAFLMARGL